MQSPPGGLSAERGLQGWGEGERGGRGEVRPRSGTQVIAPTAWVGGTAQAAGAPLLLSLPQAVSRQRKPPGTAWGWEWRREKGVTQLRTSMSLAGVYIPSVREFFSVPHSSAAQRYEITPAAEEKSLIAVIKWQLQ